MKKLAPFALVALVGASCSSPATGPSSVPGAPASVASSEEGRVSAAAITIDRIRLRRPGGADIVTNLVNGQVVDVPFFNAPLEIWAEIQRLETDSARLVVDWGNTNNDHDNCGSCRLQNTYVREGEYPVSIKVIDLNAPTDQRVIRELHVTLNVTDGTPTGEVSLVCAAVSSDFNGLSLLDRFPISIPGMTVTGNVLGRPRTVLGSFLNLGGRALGPQGDMTITFDTDKNALSLDYAGLFTELVSQEVTLTAFDSLGRQVSSATRTPGTPAGILNVYREDTFTVTGPAFRSIVLSSSHVLPGALLFDNLQASCR